MTAAFAGNQKPLINELLKGKHHRPTRHAKLFRKNSARRKRHGRRNLTVENGRHDGLTNLSLKGLTILLNTPAAPAAPSPAR